MVLESITSHQRLLEATASRFRRVFGDSATRIESTVSMAAAPGQRHETLRARLESRTPIELLRGNPSEAIERRLRRLGFSAEVIRAATGSGSALEG